MFSSNASQVSDSATYIEDVFSTWLYTGNGSTQTITNGIDLAGEGGLVWLKQRDLALDHLLMDSARGATNYLSSNTTSGQNAGAPVTFTSTGLSIASGGAFWNQSSNKYASWTFRKQPKFFDVVTYTGTGVARTVAHNLGSVPGFIIVKRTDAGGAWTCFHRSLANTQFLPLNATNAAITNANVWNSTSPTSTVFTVGTDTDVNASGGTYVAYVFAHNAGGFGLSGTDNVISCGSYTGTGAAGNFVSLGYEPQWLLIKRTNTTGNWLVLDNMRGITTGGVDAGLFPNLSNAEDSANDYLSVNATGFELTGVSTTVNASGSTYIYIAIRRGPMKVPTTGTSVFAPVVSASAVGTATTTNFPVDLQIFTATGVTDNKSVVDRLRGVNTSTTLSSRPRLNTVNTDAEASSTLYSNNWGSTGFGIPGANASVSSVYWNFRRAPGFFDEVCRNGTGANATQAHNLAASPELVITKKRSAINEWYVTHSFTASGYQRQYLEQTAAASSHLYTDNFVWTARPTTSSLFFGSNSNVNQSGQTFVDYLFATCPGVSKVGSYTGTGTTQQINCGFTGGARFVLIKRTDSTGAWYVWDSARGIVAGNDPYLLLNSTAAEVTSTDYVDTYSAGFEISSTAPADINASGGSFIFLAIA